MISAMQTIVILGGYGNFGKRIAQALNAERRYRLVIAGKDADKALEAATALGIEPRDAIALDTRSANLAQRLGELGATLVIHTAGPFQDQDYSVARACIEARAHYIDLADGRAFVCGIDALTASAKRNGVLVASGASSLPALSCAVIDELQMGLAQMQAIDVGITSGALPPGQATMRGVFAYIGKPFLQWRAGTWHAVYGWQDLRARRYPKGIGVRLMANCDVPDLELFPLRYSQVQHVVFQAGVGPCFNMLGIWLASWLIRGGLLKSLLPLVPILHASAARLARFGSRRSAMHVSVRGVDANERTVDRRWYLLADNDHGPAIPCFPAIALAKKLLRGDIQARGAQPCIGLLSVKEILNVGAHLDIEVMLEPTQTEDRARTQR